MVDVLVKMVHPSGQLIEFVISDKDYKTLLNDSGGVFPVSVDGVAASLALPTGTCNNSLFIATVVQEKEEDDAEERDQEKPPSARERKGQTAVRPSER